MSIHSSASEYDLVSSVLELPPERCTSGRICVQLLASAVPNVVATTWDLGLSNSGSISSAAILMSQHKLCASMQIISFTLSILLRSQRCHQRRHLFCTRTRLRIECPTILYNIPDLKLRETFRTLRAVMFLDDEAYENTRVNIIIRVLTAENLCVRH